MSPVIYHILSPFELEGGTKSDTHARLHIQTHLGQSPKGGILTSTYLDGSVLSFILNLNSKSVYDKSSDLGFDMDFLSADLVKIFWAVANHVMSWQYSLNNTSLEK